MGRRSNTVWFLCVSSLAKEKDFGSLFALFFIAEYGSMLLMSFLTSILFFGGWLGLFNSVFELGFKVLFMVFGLVWVRAAFPRYRYDQLMRLGWKVFLPLSLGWVFIVSSIILLLGVV